MWWLAVAVLVGWFWYSGDENVIDGALNLLDTITNDRGLPVTHAPQNSVGLVDVDPQSLADEAGVSIDVYALARMLASEEPHSDKTTKAAIAWCAYNMATLEGKTVSALLLQSKTHPGYFGSQKDKDPDSSNFGGSDRYATTSLDPYDQEIAISGGVYDGTIPDLTNGSQQFDRPAGEKHPDKVAAKRVNAGAELVQVDGVDPGLRFWRT